jgi:hypothetical protein
MKESYYGDRHKLFPEREELFRTAEKELNFPAEIYRLGDRFEGLTPELEEITMLDVTKIPGCHYGAKNVFVPIVRRLEESRGISIRRDYDMPVFPGKVILVEPSTGNGWVAFSDAAEMLGYEHKVIMPDGLPEPRYHHPQGRQVEIIRTPKEEYAQGMPKQFQALISQNWQRFLEGKKIFVSPNHSVGGAEITVETMSELGRQLMANLGNIDKPIRLVVSMGNGASICAIGEYVKSHGNAQVIATEDFAYGAGFDSFGNLKGYVPYRKLFGVDPGNKKLMDKFTTYGTNAPIGIEMPLQKRAIEGKLIDGYWLFTDDTVLEAYKKLNPSENNLKNALNTLLVPNRDRLPKVLFENYGNSTLGNIAVASLLSGIGEKVVAMAYDSRKNY